MIRKLIVVLTLVLLGLIPAAIHNVIWQANMITIENTMNNIDHCFNVERKPLLDCMELYTP